MDQASASVSFRNGFAAKGDSFVRHATALGFKLAVYLVIFGVSMPVFSLLALPQSMVIAAVNTLLLWLSDLVVLPRFGPVVATAGDFLTMVMITPLVLGAMVAFPNPLGLAIAFAAATAFEWWFHSWLLSTGIIE